jgi:hypothetical protein
MKVHYKAVQPVRTALWHFQCARYLLTHPVERHAVARNSDLRRAHDGARCFILGNGPSLLNDDLSLLNGEIVFTLNNLVAADVGAPSPDYHVVSDRRFFSVKQEAPADQAIIDRLVKIVRGEAARDGKSPITFAPSSEIGILERLVGDAVCNIRYFCNPYYFSDFYTMSTDLTGLIPRFSSVIQHAIVIALFMGFNEIYLLGCDATNIVANVQTALSESTASSYAYEVSSELDEWFRHQYAKRTMERCAESFLEVLVGFRFISDFCRRSRVELVNCSSKTVVDSLVRSRLKDVL